MKLLYLFIKNHPVFDNQEFNFDSNERFHFDHGEKRLNYRKNDKLPMNFFHSIDSTNQINISAVIGNNGVGKTSVAQLVTDILLQRHIYYEYILIFKIAEQYFLDSIIGDDICYSTDFLESDKKEQRMRSFKLLRQSMLNEINFMSPIYLAEDIKIYYHSNFYNTNDNWSYEGDASYYNVSFKDISTTNILRYSFDKYLNPSTGQESSSRYSQTELFRRYELLKQVNFLSNLNNWSIDIPLPHKVRIEYNSSDWDRWVKKYRATVDNKDTGKFLRRYFEITNDCKSVGILFWKYFFLSLFGNWMYYNYEQQHKIIWSHPKKIRNFFNGLLRILHDFFNKNTKQTKKYFNLTPILDDFLKPFLNTNDIFCAHYNEAEYTKLVPALGDIWELIKILDEHSSHESQPYFDLKVDNFAEFEKLWNLHGNICQITSFLSAEYHPALSSGEMATLNLYSRLYNNIISTNGNSNILLFLDETEITMHPELQRKIVYNLIRFIEHFQKFTSIHIVFLTHSPIILSDIPQENVCFLRKDIDGKNIILNEDIPNTFGANIFDLYKKSFSLENGNLGEFSTKKIEYLLNIANNQNNICDNKLKEIEKIICLLGDPLIKTYINSKLKKY